MNLYDVQQINYDPTMSQKLIKKLENLGLECIAVNQFSNVMNAMIDDSEILIYPALTGSKTPTSKFREK